MLFCVGNTKEGGMFEFDSKRKERKVDNTHSSSFCVCARCNVRFILCKKNPWPLVIIEGSFTRRRAYIPFIIRLIVCVCLR